MFHFLGTTINYNNNDCDCGGHQWRIYGLVDDNQVCPHPLSFFFFYQDLILSHWILLICQRQVQIQHLCNTLKMNKCKINRSRLSPFLFTFFIIKHRNTAFLLEVVNY